MSEAPNRIALGVNEAMKAARIVLGADGKRLTPYKEGQAEGHENADGAHEGNGVKDRAMQWLIAGGIVFVSAIAVWASVVFMKAEGIWWP